jgi:hypothetical protein
MGSPGLPQRSKEAEEAEKNHGLDSLPSLPLRPSAASAERDRRCRVDCRERCAMISRGVRDELNFMPGMGSKKARDLLELIAAAEAGAGGARNCLSESFAARTLRP